MVSVSSSAGVEDFHPIITLQKSEIGKASINDSEARLSLAHYGLNGTLTEFVARYLSSEICSMCGDKWLDKDMNYPIMVSQFGF